MYALADCNNFFASCERVFRPELNGKPVIVLSNNDGCAVARSNEAKALGIKMGDPLFKIRDIVERNHVHVFSGNFALYGDMSRRVQEVLRYYSPSIEVYSIDEAFLDLDGMDVDFDKYAKEISRECWRQTSIPVSMGIAPTKTLAKIASKLCKRYSKLKGGCHAPAAGHREGPEEFPRGGCLGHRKEDDAKARGHGREDRLGLREPSRDHGPDALPPARLPDVEGTQGHPLHRAGGHDRTAQDHLRVAELQQGDHHAAGAQRAGANFAEGAVTKLRSQHSIALEMVVFAITNRFKENAPQTYASKYVVIPDGTADHRIFIRHALEGCRDFYRPGYGYKKAGVVITRLVQEEGFAHSLFSDMAALERSRNCHQASTPSTRPLAAARSFWGRRATARLR